MKNKTAERLRESVCAGLVSAVVLSACAGVNTASAKNQMFLFPQFSGSAAAEKNPDSDSEKQVSEAEDNDSDEIICTLKICELFERLFGTLK